MKNQLNPPAIVGEAVAGQIAKRAAAVRIELEHLNSLLISSTFDVADLLAEVKENNYYGAWGYETFEEYVEVVLGMKKVKAYYLVRIVNTAKKLEIPREKYQDIQITKLREIFTLNPFDKEGKPLYSPVTSGLISDHIKNLVDKASKLKLTEVVDIVSKIKGQTGNDAMVFFNLKVTKNCRDNVILPAQELARKRLGSQEIDSEGDAHDYSSSVVEELIHAEFLADANNVDSPPVSVVESEKDEEENEPIIDIDDDTSEPLGGVKI